MCRFQGIQVGPTEFMDAWHNVWGKEMGDKMGKENRHKIKKIIIKIPNGKNVPALKAPHGLKLL